MKDDKDKPPVKPLFSNSPTDRTQPINQDEIVPKTNQKSPPKTVKDIPYSTRSSRITTALLKLDDKQRTIVKAKTEGNENSKTRQRS